MLNFFNSFVVPGVDNVTIFHDDQDPLQFYMLPEFPSIKQAPDGGPMFNLIIFARDFKLFKDAAQGLAGRETEGGLINMTTQLAVSQADQARIIQYIQNDMGRSPLLNMRPAFRMAGRVLMEPLYQFSAAEQPRLSYPIWVEPPASKVSFTVVPAGGETFVKATAGSERPSLIAENIATYTALLGQEGAELVRNVAAKGSVIGNVQYTVSFVARIPSLKIRIYGDASNIYKEIKEYCQVNESYQYDGSTWRYSYPAVSSLQQLKTISASLRVEVDMGDFQAAGAGGAAQTVVQQVQTMALNIAQTYLQNVFFAQPFSPGLDAAKLGTDPLARDPKRDASRGAGAANQLYLKEFRQEMSGSFDFQINVNSNITITKYPNAMLVNMISPQAIIDRIITADLSNPYFQVLDVPVQVTADFVNDPIAAITVQLNYDQLDERSGDRRSAAETFTYTTGKEVFRFQAVMAKTQDGTPKDTYTYRSEIHYKASAATERTQPQETTTRALVLGYDQLHCVRVQAVWGALPANIIGRVQVHFKYPGLNSPTAEKDIFLAPDHPTDSWFTYTGDNVSPDYQYQVTYFQNDGQRIDGPLQTTSANSLVINAPFEDMLRVTFVPQGSFPPVNSIVVTARYSDPARGYHQEETHVFTSLGSTWNWAIPLPDRSKRDFEYKVDVTYNDGAADAGEWRPGSEGTILIGQVARQILEITVVPSLLDLQRTWKLVIVRLNYSDPANGVAQDTIFQVTAANAATPLVWKVPLKDASRRTFTYQVDAFGFDNSSKTLGPLQTDNRLLVLQL